MVFRKKCGACEPLQSLTRSAPESREALRDCVGNTLVLSVCQLNDFETAFVDGLELNTEEHGGDVRQNEGLVLLD